jgi:O-antigen/teichoic acid export membrane protein
MAAQLVTWCLSLVATVTIPRFLGAELVGRFHLATSIWAMGVVVANFGMDLVLTKEVARNHSRLGSILVTSLAARMLLLVPVTLLVFGYAIAIDYPTQVLVLLGLLGAGTVVQAAADSLSAVLKGLDRMAAVSIAAIAGRFVFVVGAVGLLLLGYSIYAVAIVVGVGAVVTVTVQFRALRRARRDYDQIGPLQVDAKSMIRLLRDSLPYFWITLFVVIYLQVDTIVISLVVDSDEVLGWYSVYDRLGGTLMFVPMVFMTAVFPTLSRLYAPDRVAPHEDHKLTQRTFQAMLLVSVPIGLGLATISRPLVVLLFGDEFSNAAPVLAVGGFVIMLTYLTTVLGTFLISMDRQRQWTRFIAVGAFLTIPLDFLLVPFFQSRYDNGAIGGAVAYIITETIILSGAIHLLPRGALGPSSLSFVFRVFAAGTIMAGAVYPLRNMNLLIPIVVGAIVYGIGVYGLRLISDEDKRLLLALAPDRLARRG